MDGLERRAVLPLRRLVTIQLKQLSQTTDNVFS